MDKTEMIICYCFGPKRRSGRYFEGDSRFAGVDQKKLSKERKCLPQPGTQL